MITNRDILTWLQALAPPELAESWDNNGLLCGRLDAPAGRVLVALDPFLPAAEEAADWGAGLLLTHHPLLFRPARAVTDETALISVFYGEGATEEQAQALADEFAEKYPDCDVEMQHGGQPTYCYILSVE